MQTIIAFTVGALIASIVLTAVTRPTHHRQIDAAFYSGLTAAHAYWIAYGEVPDPWRYAGRMRRDFEKRPPGDAAPFVDR